MPKIVQSGIKMGLGIAIFSLVFNPDLHPYTVLSVLFLYLCGWCVWLWIVGHGWRWRLLATFGFALMPFGYWVADERMTLFFQEREIAGLVLIPMGIGVLAYADYQRAATSQPKSALLEESNSIDDRVWPPAPKKPH